MSDLSSQQLWDIFLDEGEANVRQCLDRCGADATDGQRRWLSMAADLEILESQAALMGVPEVTDMAAAIKAASLRAARTDAGIDAAALVEAIARSLEVLARSLEQLGEEDSSGARLEPGPIQEQICKLRLFTADVPASSGGDLPPLPAPSPAAAPGPGEPGTEPAVGQDVEIWVPQVDDDMIEPFIQECNDRIEGLSTRLLQLEETRDPELIREIFRDLHTIKGSSGFVGLERMNRLSHVAEDLVGEMRSGARAPDRGVIDALLATMDGLKAILDQAATGATIDVPIAPLIAHLRAPNAPPPDILRAPGQPASPGSAAAASSATIRVDFDKLDHLLNLVGELVLGKARIHDALDDLGALTEELDARHRRRLTGPSARSSGADRRPAAALSSEELGQTIQRLEALNHVEEEATSRLDMVSAELRDQVMKLRMLPISRLFNKHRRIVRDLCKAQDKQVRLEISGAETELDKLLVERLDDPLLHLVRNAVDHGIEPPRERERAGKPAEGTVGLSASHRGNQIEIELSDDGAGIDPERIGAKAVERGLITDEDLSRMDHNQILELIFLPGLSTSAAVTDLSGRGVGMDVVRESISNLKGSIDIRSVQGQGTRFVLKLPLTLAISNVLLCQAGGQVLAVPLHAVKHTLMADPARTRQVAAFPTLKLEEEIPLIEVASVLGLSHAPQEPPFPVALVEALGGTFGLVFERLIGRQEIVIKSLGSLLDRVPCCAGATLLGERCALILDVPALVRRALESPDGLSADEIERAPGPAVLVVEDSDIVREDLHRLLAGAGFAVSGARDGAEALALCSRRRFDLVSTDVMMPGIDGYELCRQLRQLRGYQHVPIMMLTGRDQEIDKIRGFDAGVDAYLIKPVNRDEMLVLVRRLVESSSKPREADPERVR